MTGPGVPGAVVRATVPCPAPPGWAVAEIALFELLDQAWRQFSERVSGPGGELLFAGPMASRDGADDFYEAFVNWPQLYALGGGADLLAASAQHWRGVTGQLERLGMLRGEYERGYDWFHQGEAQLLFYGLCLATPGQPEWTARAVRFADLYARPEAGNYDAERNLIRAPHTGSDGPRPGISASEHYPWRRELAARYGYPLDWLTPPPGVDAHEYLIGRAVQDRLGQGDVAVNLASTALVANAYLATGDERFAAWVRRYTDGWAARAVDNGGLVPDNVGLTGVVGEYLGGRWYGGHYGWSWPHGLYSVLPPALIAGLTASLVAGWDGGLDMARHMIDTVLELGSDGKLADSDSSLLAHWTDRLGADHGPVRLYPHRYNDRGWFDRSPLHPGWLTALWHHTGDAADAARLERVRAESGYEWRGFRPFRDKEDAGHEDGWYSFVTGRDDGYPEAALRGAQAQVRHRLALLAAHVRPPVTEDDIHLWQQVNPVTTEVLTQLTLGAPQMLYNGGLLQARVRYFDAARRRPGLPPGVAALVSRVDPADTVVDLVNTHATATASVVVQAGAYGESEFTAARCTSAADTGPGPWQGHEPPPAPAVSETALTPDGPWLTVELPPSTQIRLRLGLALRTRPPSYALPWLWQAARPIVPRPPLRRVRQPARHDRRAAGPIFARAAGIVPAGNRGAAEVRRCRTRCLPDPSWRHRSGRALPDTGPG
jgi:hypothetical protein